MSVWDDFIGGWLKNIGKKHPKKVKIVKIIIIGYLAIVLGLGHILIFREGYEWAKDISAKSPETNLTDAQLKTKTEDVVNGLKVFVYQRETNKPPWDWDNTDEYFAYDDETKNLYFAHFASDIKECYREFKLRGKEDKYLDIYIEEDWLGGPNPLWDIALTLEGWAKELES